MLLEADLVRIYFEINGFYVKNTNQGIAGTPRKIGDYTILNIKNSNCPESGKLNFQLFGSDISKLKEAQILIRPHHLEKTTLKTVKNGAKLLSLIKKDINNFGKHDPFDDSSHFRILITPGFPKENIHREELITILKNYSIDAVLSYRTVFENILKNIDLNQRYPKDSPLELLRLLKIYDLIQGPQLELFR